MSDLRPSESKGCLEQRASFHINRSEVRRKQPGCVEVKGNRATYCSDSRELYIQWDKPRRPAGMRRAVRWGEALATDGVFVGSRFSAFFPFPNIPDFPEFPSLPHRLPTPLTLRQVFGSPRRSFPAVTFTIKASVKSTSINNFVVFRSWDGRSNFVFQSFFGQRLAQKTHFMRNFRQ